VEDVPMSRRFQRLVPGKQLAWSRFRLERRR